MIKITKYGHAIIISMLGIVITSYPWLWTSFIGGIMIGYGLKLARQYGEENGKK
jgi:hypothetical protein